MASKVCDRCHKEISPGSFVALTRKGDPRKGRTHLNCDDPAMERQYHPQRLIQPAVILPSRPVLRRALYRSRLLQVRNTDFEGGKPSREKLKSMAYDYMVREFRRGAQVAKQKAGEAYS